MMATIARSFALFRYLDGTAAASDWALLDAWAAAPEGPVPVLQALTEAMRHARPKATAEERDRERAALQRMLGRPGMIEMS